MAYLSSGVGASFIRLTRKEVPSSPTIPANTHDHLPLYHPGQLKEQLLALSRSVEGFDGLVNTLNYLPRGRTSSHGWFLTTRGDIHDYLQTSETVLGVTKPIGGLENHLIDPVSIQFKETGELGLTGPKADNAFASNSDFTIEEMLVIDAYAVTGLADPEEALPRKRLDPPGGGSIQDTVEMLEDEATNWRNQFYVVHVVDWRYFAHLSCVTKSYNDQIRLWEEGDAYVTYNRSQNGLSTPAILSDLWGMLPDDMGTLTYHDNCQFPEVKLAENNKFWGMTAWDAFWSILDESFNTLVRRYDGSFEVWPIEEDTPDPNPFLPNPIIPSTLEDRINYEQEAISVSNDITTKSLPETIRVVFPKWDYQWQTSTDAHEVTPLDYWNQRPIWYIDKDVEALLGLPASEWQDLAVIAGSCKIIHSGVLAQFSPRDSTDGDTGINDDPAANPNPQNEVDLQELATLLATKYANTQMDAYDFVDSSVSGRLLEEHYRGFIPFTPTAQLSSIVWGETGGGPRTRIQNLPYAQEGNFDRDSRAIRPRGGSGGGSSRDKYNPDASSSQRVANEYPGSPDHARLDEPSLRWCVAQLSAECNPLAEVVAVVKYGLPTAGDNNTVIAGDQMIQWDGTSGSSTPSAATLSTKTINVNNATAITVASGTRVIAFWNEQIRRWVFVPWSGAGIIRKGGDICSAIDASHAVVGGTHAGERWIYAFGHSWMNAYEHDNCVDQVKLLRTNVDTFLRTYRRTAAYSLTDPCAYGFAQPVENEMLISLDASMDQGGSVFFSDGTKVRWTKAPHIGKEILLGDGYNRLDPPRIRFQHSETATLSVPAALTDFFEIICRPINTNLVTKVNEGVAVPYVDEVLSMSASVILPNDTDAFSVGQNLSIKSTGGSSDPNCLKLRWTAPGVFPPTGALTVITSVDFVAGTTKERTLHFDDGVLIGATNPNTNALEGADWYRTDAEDADCSYVAYAAPDPCVNEDGFPHSH